MATQWQAPHFIVVAAASALAFAGGYMVAGRSRPPVIPPLATNMSNDAAPMFPPFAGNDQAPQRRRVDENQLVAENAEREESGQPQRDEPARETERRRPPREEREEEMPPDQPIEEEDPGYGPEGKR